VTCLVDGNAIAGDLFTAYGRELTNVPAGRGCGTEFLIAELRPRRRASASPDPVAIDSAESLRAALAWCPTYAAPGTRSP
jgi:hypothetical protein